MRIVSLLLLFAAMSLAAPPAISTTPTFECMSLYWPWTEDLSTATGSSVCTTEYRKTGDVTWLPGLDLWADPNNSRFAGSVVYLDPNNSYDFRLTCDTPSVQTTVTASTLDDSFGDGTVNQWGAKTSQFTITTASNGTAGNYTVFENGSMITANPGGPSQQVVINANVQYVKIRNVDFDGGLENCIQIGTGCTDIVIEDCTFRNWGFIGLNDSAYNANIMSCAAIATAPTPDSDLARITIQRCEFDCTAGGSNDYQDFLPRISLGTLGEVAFTAVTDEGGGQISFTVADTTDMDALHGEDDYAPKKFGVEDSTNYDTQVGETSYTAGSYPNLYVVDSVTATKVFTTGSFVATDSGTLQFDINAHTVGHHAIAFNESSGQHVFRYNLIHSPGVSNLYNDCIGGSSNASVDKGALGNDTDVHGNEFRWAGDNAIEAEGSGTNVRIWNNYIRDSRVAIATAAIKDGPLYTWRNVITECRSERENQTDSAACFKTGNNSLGRQYWFFNTVTQDGSTNGYAKGIGNDGGGTPPVVSYWYSRNNIIDVEGVIAEDDADSATHDLDLDVSNKAIVFTGNLQTNNYDGGTTPPSGGTGYWTGTVTFDSTGQFPGCNAGPLNPASLAYRAGEAIPNFGMNSSTRATITDPDVGALDSRMPTFIYGIPSKRAGTINISGTVIVTP